MSTKIKEEKGVEHEVYTPEEISTLVEQKVGEARSQFETQLNQKEIEMSSIKSELETAKEALGKAGEGTVDWATARNQIKVLEGKITEITTEKEKMKTDFASDIRNVRTSVFQGQIDSMVEGLSTGDAEVAKKIKFHYDRLGGEVSNEKEAAERFRRQGRGAPADRCLLRPEEFREIPRARYPSL